MSLQGEIYEQNSNSYICLDSVSRGDSPVSRVSSSTFSTRSNTPSVHSRQGAHSNQMDDPYNIKLKTDLLANQVDRNTIIINKLQADINQLNQRFDTHIINHERQLQQVLDRVAEMPTMSQIENLIHRMLSNFSESFKANNAQVRPGNTDNDFNVNTNPEVVSSNNRVPTENTNQISGSVNTQHNGRVENTCSPVMLQNANHMFIPINQMEAHDTYCKPTQPVVKPVVQTKSSSSSISNQTRSDRHIEHTKPHSYDGTSSWNDYKIHFETVSKLNQWSEEVKSLKLIACMSGTALAVLGDIDINNPPKYQELLDILTKRFAPTNQTEMYRAQIETRIRKRNETLPELAQDLKRLTRLAYPTATPEIRDILTYKAFREALNDNDLEWAICQANVETIDAALHVALKYEAFYASKKRPTLRQQKVDNSEGQVHHSQTNRESKNKARKCHYCNKSGHFIKDCYKRLHDQQNFVHEQSNQREILPNSNQGNVSNWATNQPRADQIPGQGLKTEQHQGN